MRVKGILIPVPAALLALALVAGCSERDITDLPQAEGNTDPLVFTDAWGADVYYQPFYETNYTAVSIDSVFAHGEYQFNGGRSLKFTVPPYGSALGDYLGGAVTSAGARDLTGYNALTFYARSDQSITVDVFGFGNDNTGTSRYEANRKGTGAVALNGDWKFVVVPIPDPSRIVSERGLLTLAESLETDAQDVPTHPEGYHIWLDDIRYAKLDNIEVFRASLPYANATYFIGSTVNVAECYTIFKVDGANVVVYHSPNYFNYASSADSVAVVEGETIRVVGEGSAQITATLGELPVIGRIDVVGFEPPTNPAPTPTLPASDVISLFSDSYTDVLVDTWRADWADGMTTQLRDFSIDGDPVKMYTSLNWVGIIFQTRTVDASLMTAFHLDLYAPGGTNFGIELFSFEDPENGAGSNKILIDANSDPAYATGQWVSIDIPLSDFDFGPDAIDPLSALGQLVLSSDGRLVLVDNVYFHD